jgi:hypothetical protein
MCAMGCAKSPTNAKRLGCFPSLGGQKAIPLRLSRVLFCNNRSIQEMLLHNNHNRGVL